MKKIYFLLFTLMFGAFSFAQTTVFINELHYDNASSDVDEGLEIAGPAGTNLTGWTIEKYNGSNGTPYGTENLSGTITDQDNGYGTLGFIFAANALQNGAPDAIALVDDMGAVIQFLSYEGSLTAVGGPADGLTSTDIGVAETSGTAVGESLQLTGTGDTYEEFTWSGPTASSSGAVNSNQSFSAVNSASITITSPADATVFAPGTTNVDLEFSTTNLNGGETVSVTVNGNTTNNATSPFSITTVDGTTYNVTVDLIDGGILDSDMVSFSVGSLVTVADIAALRADVVANGLGRFYEITGSSLVTHTDGFRNRKWIEDTNISGVLIYDDPGVITTTYNVGDLVSGLRGTTTDSNGILRFIPTSDSGIIVSSGNPVAPQVVTIADLNASPDNYESELVELQNVTFTDGDGTATFSTGTNYDITDGVNTIVKRTDFFGADYIGEIIPSTQVPSVVAVAGEFNGTAQIYMRNLNDVTLSTSNFETSNFSLYPNPTNTGFVTFVSLSNDAISVQVFDILGKQVKNETLTNNRLNVSNLNTGVYIVKITQNDASTTKKLVIK